MASEPIVHHKGGETAVAKDDACDCSFDVLRGSRGARVVKSFRYLDPTERGDRYLGVTLDALTPAVGPTVVAAVQAIVDAPSADVTQVLMSASDSAFRVVTAREVDPATVRVTVRCLASTLLPDLVDAKVTRVADSSGLSERERQVLRLLLRGRGVEDIATMLEIAPRTVKFHQANVLQKLGADSRLDLLRVVL